MVKYRVSWGKIESYEVSSETEKTVTYYCSFFKRAIKENKKSSRHKWFDTWDEARQHLIYETACDLDKTRAEYIKSITAHKSAKAMRKP